MTQITVTNDGPQIADLKPINHHLLEAFRSVLPVDEQYTAAPFEHQVAGWEKISRGEEVGLVAGTAAGKTLTTAVPLLDKLFRQKSIRKVLFLYPTLALLEDQYQTLQKLLKHYIELDLSEKDAIDRVRGGLKSSQLIQALSKPIIVATPDSVYWFFRKNIKYNAFLIYGLLQVDEIVIDEAHLFNGLMLQNTQQLLDRIRFLKKEYLNQPLKVHYLTATSNEATTHLSPHASPPIPGKSKCGNVDLIIEEKMPIWEREARMADLSKEMLAMGKQQVLVVCNSARRAHRIFDTLRDNRRSTEEPDLPDIFWKTFGLVEIGPAMKALENLDSETAKQIQAQIQKHISLSKRNIQTSIKLQPEYCAGLCTEWLARQYGQLRRTLHSYRREAGDAFNGDTLQATIEASLREMFDLRFREQSDFEAALQHLDQQIDIISEWLEEAWSRLSSEPGYVEVQELNAAAFRAIFGRFPDPPANLPEELGHYLNRNLTLNSESLYDWQTLGLKPYVRQKISLRRLLSWVEVDEISSLWEDRLLQQVKKEHSAVGVLRDDPNGAVIILYSGSMARYARDGLIDLFKALKDLGRPAVLIATSAVEVGVDFAADALITEECPASGFLQRFGRVGRREGLQSLVHVLVSDIAYQELNHHLGGRAEITREDFSTLLTNQLREGFQERKYLATAQYAKAAHRIITRQLGQVGEAFIAQNPDPTLDALADTLRHYDIDPAYGLRGTLPGVALADSGVSKDPFYILSYVSNDDIEPSTSPFEVAHVRRYFNELIYKSWQRTVMVDIEWTLNHNTVIVVPEDQLVSISKTHQSPAQYFLEARQNINQSPPMIQPMLLEQGYKLPPATMETLNLLLGYGDVYLKAVDRETEERSEVETYDRKRLRLANQWYLILLGCDEMQAKAYLQQADAGDFDSEVYYDFEGVNTGVNDKGVVLLERQTGAVWELWQRLRGVMGR